MWSQIHAWMRYSHPKILQNNNWQAVHNMDEFHKCNVEPNKPDTEEFITSEPVCTECKNSQS